MSGRSVRAVMLALCLASGAGTALVPTLDAHAQAAETFVEGQLIKVDPEGRVITLAPGGVLTVAPDAAASVFRGVTEGTTPMNAWVRATLRNDQVAAIVQITAPAAVANPGLDERIRAIRDTLAKLKKGDRVRLNGVEGVYDHVTSSGQVLFTPNAGRPNYFSVREGITSLEKVDSIVDPGHQTPDGEKGFTPGQPYRLKLKAGGELYGYFGNAPDADEPSDFTLFDAPGQRAGEIRKVSLTEVASHAKAEPPTTVKVPQPGVGTPVAPQVTVVVSDFGPGDLNFAENVWRLQLGRGQARHALAGNLVVGARITITYRGLGTMQAPAVEAEILQAMGDQLAGVNEGSFEYQSVKHYFQRGPGGGAIVAVIEGKGESQPVTVTIPDAIFPGVPEPFGLETKLFNPVRIEEPKVALDPAKNIISFKDERAVPHLIKAHSTRGATHQDAALRAMIESRNPRLLPYLLLDFYANEGARAEQLKRTIGFFTDRAETFLEGLIKTNGWEKPFEVPNPQGGVDRPEAGDKERLLARIIELLQHLEADGANQYILPLVRHSNDAVRTAARDFFVQRSRAKIERIIGWLVLKLVGPHATEAKIVLKMIEAAHPGALSGYISTLKDADPTHETKLVGLPPEEATEKRVEFLVAFRQANESMGEGDAVREARLAIEEIVRGEVQAGALKRELAGAYAAQAVRSGAPGGEERRRRMTLLKRAVTLDPANESARRELAAVYVDIARELRKGVYMRSGPGEEFKVVRELKVGEQLAPEPLPEGQEPHTAWRYVKVVADGTIGYIPVSIAEQGNTKLIVLRDHRPFADRRKFLHLARAFYPGRLTEIEEGLAELAAIEAQDAARDGDWKLAFDRYRTAEALAPGQYRFALAGAYVRANPLVGVLALMSIGLFVAAVVGGRKRVVSGLRKPPAPPELSRENVAAKKVPS